jgi:hypothetical protein
MADSTTRATAATVRLLLGVHERTIMSVLGWSTTAMVSRYAHVIAPIQRRGESAPTCCSGRAQTAKKTIEMLPDETKDETKISNAGAHLVAGPAFRLVSWRWRRDLNPRRVAPHALSRRAL